MGATSVTGTGPGSVDGSTKGSEHMSLGTGHLIGPRVMISGTVVLTANPTMVDVPPLSGATTDYMVLTTNQGVLLLTAGSLSSLSVVNVYGTVGQTVGWAVVKKGV